MILNLAYTSKNIYISNQIKFELIYLLDLGAIGLYTKDFYNLINALTFIKSIYQNCNTNKTNIYINMKS